jgi:flagellar hook-associated protein 1 FlgK
VSDFSALTVGLSGLEANQMGLDVVGQNVANADTAGYVDEQLNLSASPMVQQSQYAGSASGLPGNGVQVAGVERMSNTFLQQQSYAAQADQGTLTAEQTGLQSIQNNFPDLSGSGVSAELTQLWSDWSNLANNPSSQPTRATLVQDATSLTSSLNQTYSALSALSSQTVQDVTTTLQQVNQYAKQIASLNQQILAAGSGSTSVADLQDQRDAIISKLSKDLGVTVGYNSNGTANVYSGTEALVSGSSYQALSVANTTTSGGAAYSLVWSQDGSSYQPSSGSVAGMLEVANTYVPQYQGSLDQVAQSLAGSVNYLMSTGYDLNGNPGQPFFLGTGASNIEVNPKVAADPSLIAAASTPVQAGSTASSALATSTTITSSNDTLNYMLGTASETFTIPAATYSPSQLAAALQSASGGNLTATINASGDLALAGAGGQAVSVTGGDAASALGFLVASNQDGAVAASVGELPNTQNVTISVPSGGWQSGISATGWTAGATQSSGTEADYAFNQLVTSVGQATSNVNTGLANQQAVTTNINSALQSATGVNTDQEMTNMVMYQNAYDASAKFISTVQTVLSSLISMVHG